MSQRAINLPVIIAFTLFGVAWALIPTAGTFYRTLFVLPLLLLLPGYALMSFLFPKRSLSSMDQIAFSLGLSLAIAVLSGLVLNWTRWGLQAKSWALLLGALTICLTVAAQIRQRSPVPTSSTRLTMNSYTGVLFGIAVILVVAAVSVASLGAVRQRTPGFTQLWILPVKNTETPETMRIGIRNLEGIAMTYQLQLKVGEIIVADFSTIELESGAKWETEISLSSEYIGLETIEANLYRRDMPESIYRQVFLWH